MKSPVYLTVAIVVLSACSTVTEGNAVLKKQVIDAVQSRPIVLLGEVHDNAAQHAIRLAAFERLLAQGARSALLMEQFDRDRQPALDKARQQINSQSVDGDLNTAAAAMIAAGAPEKSGWNWAFYQPFIVLALRYGLPIVAANVSRADAGRAMRQGLAALELQVEIPPEVMTLQTQEIMLGHCNALPLSLAQQMVLAQVARDVFMARMIEKYRARGVVLLAGNGHTRRDIGVPIWLSPATRTNTVSIGMLEQPSTDGAFDTVILTAAQPRADPCASFTLPLRQPHQR